MSGFGSYVTLLTLQTLVVLTLDGTAQQVGWVNSARWLPYLLLGLLVGALVDRRRRRPLMVLTDLTRAGLLAAIPIAWTSGTLSLPVLMVIVTLFGTASLINDAASMAFLPRLVRREQLQRAHARLDGADAVAQMSGPALAGLLVSLVGVPIREPAPGAPAHRRSLRHEIREGMGWVYRRSGLARLAVGTHVW